MKRTMALQSDVMVRIGESLDYLQSENYNFIESSGKEQFLRFSQE